MELRGSGLLWKSAHSFVLTALDAIPRTATTQTKFMSEANLVLMMETYMKPKNFEPTFCAAVLRKWRSSAVADVLRARGVLQTGVTAYQESMRTSMLASVPTSRRSGFESAHGRRATKWSAPSASSSSAPAVAPCGTAARSITRSTGARTKRIAKSWTKRGGRRWHQAEGHQALLDELNARRAFSSVERFYRSCCEANAHRPSG